MDLGDNNTVQQSAQLTLQDMATADRRASAFSSFRKQLVSAPERTHTRIVALASLEPSAMVENGCFEHAETTCFNFFECALCVLLSALILGIEYDLEPALVIHMLGSRDITGDLDGFQFPILPKRLISFQYSQSQAFWLGRKSSDESQRFTVLVAVDSLKFPLIKGDTFCFGQAPSFSAEPDFRSRNIHSSTSLDSGTLTTFRSLLEEGPWSSTPTISRRARGHWLSALLRLEYEACWDSFGLPRAKYMEKVRDFHRLRQLEDSGIVKEFLKDTILFASELSSLRERIHTLREDVPEIDLWDAYPELRSIGRLIDEATSLRKHVKDHLQIEIGAGHLQMTRLAIGETRSCKTLTMLAFIFVPISLASSICGMSVQEINATGHSIWIFVGLAVVMLAVANVAWFSRVIFFGVRSNWRRFSRYMKQGDPDSRGVHLFKSTFKQDFQFFDWRIAAQQGKLRYANRTDLHPLKDRAKRGPCYLVLMSLEKLGMEEWELPSDDI